MDHIGNKRRPLTGISFSNRVGVEKIDTGREINKNVFEKPKDCFAVETKVAGEGHVHRCRKSPVACRKGKPCFNKCSPPPPFSSPVNDEIKRVYVISAPWSPTQPSFWSSHNVPHDDPNNSWVGLN